MTDKLLKKAINKHKAGQHSIAQNLYKKILRSKPDHVDANYMLGTSLAETGRVNSALKYVKQAERYAPASQYIKNNLGNVYRMLGDYENASRKYREALSIQSDMIQALNNLAIVQRRLNNNDQAIALYQRAISIKPEFLEAHYNLAKSYWDVNQYENAFVCFQRVLELDPQHAPATHELGNYYMKNGDIQKAIACYEKYLELADEDSFGARLKLSYLNAGELPERQPEELIRQTYEKKARTWDQDVVRTEMAFLGPEIIAQGIDALNLNSRNMKVLDVGCGTGLCASFLKRSASYLCGVDLSPHMLSLAKERNLYDELVCSDIESFNVETDNMSDLIVGSGVMIFFANLVKVMKHLTKNLEPAGYFIFTLYRSNQEDIEIRDNMHFAHSEQYIRQVATEVGLDVVTIRSVIHEYEHNQPQPGFLVSLRKPERPQAS